MTYHKESNNFLFLVLNSFLLTAHLRLVQSLEMAEFKLIRTWDFPTIFRTVWNSDRELRHERPLTMDPPPPRSAADTIPHIDFVTWKRNISQLSFLRLTGKKKSNEIALGLGGGKKFWFVTKFRQVPSIVSFLQR